MKTISYLTLSLLCFVLSNSYAQHEETETHESHGKSHAAHFHPNHIAMFGGGTSQSEKEGTHFTLGADYVRFFPPNGRWGISVFGEAIFTEHTEWLFGAPLYFRPIPQKNLWLRTGPGVEIIQEEAEGEHGHGEETASGEGSKTEFLFRAGIGYDIPVGKFIIAPSLDLDFVRSNTALVWGINIGKGF